MAGTQRALIIDVGFGDLVASAASAERVRAALEKHGFLEPTVLVGPRATVAGIKAALVAIRGELGEGDAFVLYFVGHGEVVRDPARSKEALGWEPSISDVFVLVTHDILEPASNRAGVPGITLFEWLAPIARATDNVTVILDCCHAARGIPREGDDEARDERVERSLRKVTELLRERYARYRLETTRGEGEAEGRIVCLVATTRNEYAEEGDSIDGKRTIGLFSDAVAESLLADSAGAWTWDDHIVGIQGRVLAGCASQLPGVEGPRHRLPFSRVIREPAGSYACGYDLQKVFTVHAGLLHGVAVGDTFNIVRAGDRSCSDSLATVTGVDITRSTVDGDRKGKVLRAIPVRRRRSVKIHLRATGRARETWMRDAVPGHVGVEFVADAEDVDGTLVLDEQRAVLHDAAGEVVHVDGVVGDDVAVVHRLVAAVARLAHWRRVERGLARLDPTAAPEFTVVWGSGDRELGGGETLTRQDGVWARVDPVSHGELFVSAFHVRGDRSVVDLLADLDHGWTVTRRLENELTRTASGERAPWSLGRGPGVWDGRVVREAIVLVVSPRPISLHGFATPVVTRGGARRGEAKMVTPAVVRLEFLLAPDEG